jgi:hypothetical protein
MTDAERVARLNARTASLLAEYEKKTGAHLRRHYSGGAQRPMAR